jgi:hypothetical protein
MEMEFDADRRINEYLNIEIGKRKPPFQYVFESSQRNLRNIFKTQFPIIEGKIDSQNYISVPTPELIDELGITLPNNEIRSIDELISRDGFRILNINRYLITHKTDSDNLPIEIPTQSEIEGIYPRFDAKQISEYITEERIFCTRSSSNEIAALVIVTRRNSIFSEISIRTMPPHLRLGYGLKILDQAIQHEIDMGLVVVFVTEKENWGANALIKKYSPDRFYEERMVIA